MDIDSSGLVFPMVTLFFWTFLVMLRNVQVRVQALLRGEITNEYFELFSGAEPSQTIVKTGNHLRNLFEFPLLFYAVAITIIATGKTDSVFLVLAWSYVGLRACHTLVHLTFNKVPPRFLFFILSNIVLLALWLRLAGLSWRA